MSEPLGHAQHRTLAALAESIAPPGCPLPVDANQMGVAEQIGALLGDFDPASRRLLGLLITALRLAPLAAGTWRRFDRLPRAQRDAWLAEALAGRRIGHDTAVSLRALCEMVYAGDERFRRHVGDFNEPLVRDRPLPPETYLPVLRHPDLDGDLDVECDVVVVGSGAGGATVARQLAESGLDVVIVEEGGPVSRADFDGPALRRTVKYCRNNGLTTAIGASVIPVPMGRVVGGTTVVNSGTCLRAPDSVLDEWARVHGAELAAPDRMAPQYDRLREQLHIEPVADDVMGTNGQIARRGAEELGLRAHAIPRPTRDCAGTGQCAFGCPRDAKQAMHLTHLPAAVRHGARIYASCVVDRIVLRGDRADGIDARILDERRVPTGGHLRVRARSVFVCAGALMTPLLLRRSGVARRNPALGRFLRIHPGSGVTGRFDEVVNGWQGVMQSYCIDEFVADGILLEATFPPLGMTYSAGALPGIGHDHARLLDAYPHMASIGSILSDTGTGRVCHLPLAGPTMLYRLSQPDVDKTIRAIGLAARVLFAAGAREVYAGLPAVPPLRSLGDVDELERRRFRAKDVKVSAYHPMGTARMGADARRSVCDAEGRVHGMQNLYVADTSVFPGSTHVNPQLTLMALCRNLAERFLDRWPPGL
ncbi:MAG: GMC family oxidoreductase [Myxococcota bacterium]|nr:GMC family oxidoreductase [Myxococcota bacterium]